MEWLRCQRPDLVGRYEALYQEGAYAPVAERKRLSALVQVNGRPSRFRLTRPQSREPFLSDGAFAQQSLF
jgi:hypothetical protein